MATTEARTASQPLETYAPGRPDRGAARARAAEFFLAHGAAVERLCRSLLRDPTEAEDALQQAFLSAYRALLGGTEPRDPVAWLMTIARRECLLRIRRRMREPAGNGAEAAAAPVDIHAEAVQRSELTALWHELHALPRRQRDALLLREVQGLTYDELARELAVSGPAVESLLLRARRRLRGRLSVASLPLLVRGALERLTELGGAAGGVKLATLPVAAKVVTAGVGAVVVAGVAYEAPQLERPAAARAAVHARHAAPRPATQRPARVAMAVQVVPVAAAHRPATPIRPSHRRAVPIAAHPHRGATHHGSRPREPERPTAPVGRDRDHDADDTAPAAAPVVPASEGTDGESGHDGSGDGSSTSSGRDESGHHDSGNSGPGGSGDQDEADPTQTVVTTLPAEAEAEPEDADDDSAEEAGGSKGADSSAEEAAEPLTTTTTSDQSGSGDSSHGGDSSGSGSSSGGDSSGHGGSSGDGSSGHGSGSG